MDKENNVDTIKNNKNVKAPPNSPTTKKKVDLDSSLSLTFSKINFENKAFLINDKKLNNHIGHQGKNKKRELSNNNSLENKKLKF